MVEIPNSEHIYMADLVLIELGFSGRGKTLAKELGMKMVKQLIYILFIMLDLYLCFY